VKRVIFNEIRKTNFYVEAKNTQLQKAKNLPLQSGQFIETVKIWEDFTQEN